MDLHAEQLLQRNLQVLKEDLQIVQAQQSRRLRDGDPSRSLSMQEIERQIRETKAELRTCRTRLGKEGRSKGVAVAEPFVFEFGACIGGPVSS